MRNFNLCNAKVNGNAMFAKIFVSDVIVIFGKKPNEISQICKLVLSECTVFNLFLMAYLYLPAPVLML